MLASLFLRVLDNKGDVYLPFHFEGEGWTDEEKKLISDAFAPHVPERVDAGFNNFGVFKHGDHYSARRYTWQGYTLHGRSAEALAQKIKEYYRE